MSASAMTSVRTQAPAATSRRAVALSQAHVYAHVCTHVCTQAYAHVCMHVLSIHSGRNQQTYGRVGSSAKPCLRTCPCACLHACLYTCLCACLCTFLHAGKDPSAKPTQDREKCCPNARERENAEMYKWMPMPSSKKCVCNPEGKPVQLVPVRSPTPTCSYRRTNARTLRCVNVRTHKRMHTCTGADAQTHATREHARI